MNLGVAAFGAEHVGARRLRALLVHLPPEGAVGRVFGHQWTDAVELAAVTAELVHTLIRVTLRGYGYKKALPALSIPRPTPPSAAPAPSPRAKVRAALMGA